MLSRRLIVIFLVLVLAFFGLGQALASPTLPSPVGIDKSGIWLQNATEASWFVWNNELYYVYTDRNLSGSSTQMKIVKPTFSGDKITGQTDIATFGSGYGCQDVYVDSGTLYVFATSCKMDFTHKNNSIVRFSSTDLTTWSGPTSLVPMGASAQVYNVSIDKNTSTNNWIMSFEYKAGAGTDFACQWLQSGSLTGSWSGVGGATTGSCHELKYLNGVYYQWVVGNITSPRTEYHTWLMKSTNLTNWTTSRITVLQPEKSYEDMNTTDIDLQEFDGKLYGLYMTGDQNTYMRLTYLTFNGSLAEFIDAYQEP